MKLTRQQASRLLLLHQYLLPPRQLSGKEGALAFVHHVRAVQFDPLNVVGRNPDLVLQSRVSGYTPALLEELLYTDFALLDGWDKMACLYPVEDWPFFGRWRESERHHMQRRSGAIFEVIPQVRQALAERGPLSSIDLDHNERVDWPWGPTRVSRAALEGMHTMGEVVIHHRVGTRKVYDLIERHLPAEVITASEPNPTAEAYQEAYVLRRLGSVGLLRTGGGVPWMGMSGIKAAQRTAAVQRLAERGELLEVEVEEARWPYYLRRSEEALLPLAQQPPTQAPRVSFIAPLDNLIWDRDMLSFLFDFDYRWEVYKPLAQREYGYYVLPVLYGDRFVARFEPVRNRQNNTLLIKNWWWQPGVASSAEMNRAFSQALDHFRIYQGLQGIEIAPDAQGYSELSALLN